MLEEIYINNIAIPRPDDDLTIGVDETKDEHTTESGDRIVIKPVHCEKLRISGKWTLSGAWVQRFRAWRSMDSIQVKCYYPDPAVLTEYTCSMELGETYINKSRYLASGTDGIYQISVEIAEY